MGKPPHLPAEAIRIGLASADERTRAVAARSSCVCHGDWSLFRELLPQLRELARSDPSARVRAEARHVLQDPIVQSMHDDERFDREEHRTRLIELRDEKRRVRDSNLQRRHRQRS
jgi:hypothetical protein